MGINKRPIKSSKCGVFEFPGIGHRSKGQLFPYSFLFKDRQQSSGEDSQTLIYSEYLPCKMTEEGLWGGSHSPVSERFGWRGRLGPEEASEERSRSGQSRGCSA